MPTTRWRQLSRTGAVATIIVFVVAIAILLAVAAGYTPPHTPGDADRPGDSETYAGIVDRMKAGEGYYQAAHSELLANGYGTRSVFNWRTPLYLSVLSMLPSSQDAVWLTLGLAVLAALAIGKLVFEEAGRWVVGPLALVLPVGFFGYLVPSWALLSEAPAGLLILLAIALRGLGWRKGATVSGLLALFVRELAAPVVLILVGWAALENRKDEFRVWGIGLAAYAVYFAWHAHSVAMTLGPMDQAYPEGWVQFGGLSFVLATAQLNGLFAIMPIQATAVALPVAVMGLIAWPGRAGAATLATLLLYLAAFMVVGKPFNNYWGLLYSPLLVVGLAWAPAGFSDLFRGALGASREASAQAGSSSSAT